MAKDFRQLFGIDDHSFPNAGLSRALEQRRGQKRRWGTSEEEDQGPSVQNPLQPL